MIREVIKTPGRATVVKVSRWIHTTQKEISRRHNLSPYAVDVDINTGRGWIYAFSFHGVTLCLEQFISRRFRGSNYCENAPDFIAGFARVWGFAQPLMIELDETGQRVRLYMYHHPEEDNT